MNLIKLRTYLRLGILNIARVAFYRLLLRAGYFRLAMPVRTNPVQTEYFAPREFPADYAKVPIDVSGDTLLFGYIKATVGDPPVWDRDPVSGKSIANPARHWSLISDFGPENIDIKYLWELSRFQWVVELALLYRRTGDEAYLNKLNQWLSDWAARNPVNQGPNWKCGQEASIRVIHLVAASIVLDQDREVSEGISDLIRSHLQRIAPTVSYAIGQDNNHGTSEAAALFVGGSLLVNQGDSFGKRPERLGRKLLENRIKYLVEEDGGFSQYSTNYHRLMLVTVAFSEFWRQRINRPAFSAVFYRKMKAATGWLHALIDKESGAVPNVGANDGANILSLSDREYADFRPAAQFAGIIFKNERLFSDTPNIDDALKLFGLLVPAVVSKEPQSHLYSDSGWCVLNHAAGSRIIIKFPAYRFRPSHCDALHVDLWYRGQNILMDAGTYGYNTDPALLDYFTGSAAHNTVTFGGKNQMPRVSRFLFGDWLSCTNIEFSASDSACAWAGQYTDRDGCTHWRKVEETQHGWRITDILTNFPGKAELRWRLNPAFCWQATETGAEVSGVSLSVTASDPTSIASRDMTNGWVSKSYGVKEKLPVLLITVNKPTTLVTDITLRRD